VCVSVRERDERDERERERERENSHVCACVRVFVGLSSADVRVDLWEFADLEQFAACKLTTDGLLFGVLDTTKHSSHLLDADADLVLGVTTVVFEVFGPSVLCGVHDGVRKEHGRGGNLGRLVSAHVVVADAELHEVLSEMVDVSIGGSGL